MLYEISGRRWPVGTSKPGCRVLFGVAVMCPAGCKGAIRYAVARVSGKLIQPITLKVQNEGLDAIQNVWKISHQNQARKYPLCTTKNMTGSHLDDLDYERYFLLHQI